MWGRKGNFGWGVGRCARLLHPETSVSRVFFFVATFVIFRRGLLGVFVACLSAEN